MNIPQQIKNEIELLAKNGVQCEDWIELKRYLLKSVHSDLRKLFSTRDPVTKEGMLNDFEGELILFCEKRLGKKLRIADEK